MSKLLLDGIKFSATFVDDQTESELIGKIRSLGGEFSHKMNAEVKYLVVGKRYTKKYDFALTHGTALISAEAFFSVYIKWRSGEELDFIAELESKKLRPFEGELVCLSNMSSSEKVWFHEMIASGGGQHSIAFARVNTILVSPEATGRKIDGAHKWGTPIVHPKWISDSLKFGAALNPELYSIENANAAMTPPSVVAPSVQSMVPLTTTISEENNAPVLKRRRGADLLFNAPLAKRDKTSIGPSMTSFAGPPLLTSTGMLNSTIPSNKSGGIFKDVKFGFDGFDSRQLEILNRAVKSLEGIVDNKTACDYLVVYSGSSCNLPSGGSAKVITEWGLERSIYLKRNALDEIWSLPVLRRPAFGFTGLSICISGFQGIEQRHATLLIKILGAKFLETLKEDRDVLIAASDQAHKVPYAIRWQIPVVNIDWLWKSAMEGRALPLDNEYVLDGKGSRPAPAAKANISQPNPINTSVNGFENDNNGKFYEEGNVRYHDDDAAARAQVLVALGEKPSSQPAESDADVINPIQLDSRRRHRP